MDDVSAARLAERLDDFFADVDALSPPQLAQLSAAARHSSFNRVGFATAPELLDAVSSGRWSHGHHVLARRARIDARRRAAALAPWPRRRALALALEEAALAVLADEATLPEPLLTRLSAPWVRATGRELTSRLVAA